MDGARLTPPRAQAPRVTRRALLALALLVLPGAAQALQPSVTVRDASPLLLSFDVRAGACGPEGAVAAPAGLRACVRARDANGHPDLCAPQALAHARVDGVLASGQAWSRPLACVHAEGTDAWLAAEAPPGASFRLLRAHVEDAWGLGADADLLQEGRPTTAPPRRPADLLP